MKLNYACGGASGPPLVFLHGVTRRWQSFLPVMHSLAARYRILALDLPGHGGSGPGRAGYRVTDYVSPVLDFLRARVQEPAVIYGHSLGAMVAALAAALERRRVRAVILEDPPFETMGARIRQGPLHAYFDVLRPFAGSRLPVGELWCALGEATADGIPLRNLRDPVALRFTAAALRRLDPLVLEPIVNGEWMNGYRLQPLECPSLLMQADPACGGMLTDGDAAEAQRILGDCVRVRVPGAPHLIHWYSAPELLRLAHGFLSTLD
jgi:pimeloyl-ACP methyl ester carboxylesterase